MEKRFNLKLTIDYLKVIYYDDSLTYKTDAFYKETIFLNSIDTVLEKISGEIRKNIKDINSLEGNGKYFEAALESCSFLFCFDENNVVFYKFKGREVHKNDRRLSLCLKENFEVNIHRINDVPNLNKLYLLSFEDGVSFPLLNQNQQEIVEKEEGNVLVQGVAGSGKTNICIDKIIFAACKRYSGKILYSTYSRGLLLETENKVRVFKKRIERFIDLYINKNVTLVGDFTTAISKHLGIENLNKDSIIDDLKDIISFLDSHVEYLLLSDIFKKHEEEEFLIADESTFLNEYVKNLKNYRLTQALDKIKYLDGEIIYKEIFGMIFGSSDEKLSLDRYVEKRKGSFNRIECEAIYSLAQDYASFLYKNKYVDNNIISRLLLKKEIETYSLVILDEVQDFTEINLTFFKKISRKMLCVGDALQMINPSYFSFAFLKRLMYEKDVTEVRELKHNYRNTAKLETIIESINEINTDRFGTHSFVIKGESVDSSVETVAIYTDYSFIESIKNIDLTNCTVVVGSKKKKEELRNLYEKAEILTVSEIKGLERDNIVLIDVLSDNSSKWEKLYKDILNKKTQDENSAYRYFLNLFYVGVSRARRNLYVEERKKIALFENFFINNFSKEGGVEASKSLANLIGNGKIDEDEILRRVDEFINLSQFDNALFALKNLADLDEVKKQENRISIYKDYVNIGDYKGAGVAFWEKGLLDEAKKFFDLSNNPNLSNLVDACAGENAKLDASIVSFYEDLKDNEIARELIIDTLKKEVQTFKENQKELLHRIRKINKR